VGIPDRIREVIRHRFVRLSPVCKKILSLGAFIGRGFSFHLLKVLMDMSEDEMLASIEEALAAKVVNETPGMPGQFSFTHALMAETLYAEATARALNSWLTGKYRSMCSIFGHADRVASNLPSR
jgi:predicted ATPase